MNLICVVRFACFLALSLIPQRSNAMRPNVIGYYGTYKEIDYYSLDIAAKSCISLVENEESFPDDNIVSFLDFSTGYTKWQPGGYQSKFDFYAFCNEQCEKWNGNQKILKSIDRCKKLFDDGNYYIKISIGILLREVMLRLTKE